MPPKSRIVLINKPSGVSTYDLVREYKRKSGYQGKIGHAGTLDIMAEGLVILLIGEATKKFDEFQKYEKEYIAISRLGFFSETLDGDGKVEKQNRKGKIPELVDIKAILSEFKGEIRQDIPVYSASKHQGRPLYKHARKGVFVKKQTDVAIKEIEILSYDFPLVKMRIVCSSGTYIRQLAYDIFKKLGWESVLVGLKRTRVGEYRWEKS